MNVCIGMMHQQSMSFSMHEEKVHLISAANFLVKHFKEKDIRLTTANFSFPYNFTADDTYIITSVNPFPHTTNL